MKPWRTALTALLLTGLSCCFIPLSISVQGLALPHFCLGLGVGSVDATLVPMLANLAEKRGSNNYGAVYALQQISVCLAYSFGPLLGGEAVRIVGFPWLMRLSGFLNILFCPLVLELGEKQVRGILKEENFIADVFFQATALMQGEETLPSYSSFENSWSTEENETHKEIQGN